MAIRPEVPNHVHAQLIDFLEAESRAQAYCDQLLATHHQVPGLSAGPDPKNAAFFDGWRFAYDFFLYEHRIRQTVLVLFVNKAGEVQEEWNDLGRLTQETMTNPADTPLPIALAEAMKAAANAFPDAKIETVEVVWDPQGQRSTGKGLVRCWRIGLVQGMERWSATYTAAGIARSEVRTKYSSRARFSTRWRLGDNAIMFQEYVHPDLQKQRLLVNLDKLDRAPVQRYTDYWIIWSCMARTEHFLEALGYTEVGLHNTYIELVEEETNNAEHHSGTSDRGRLPVITVTRSSAWARDVTIITHELGHAFYWLMFVRPPRTIDGETYKTALKGIEEGFADYFAAAVLINNTRVVRIGAYVIMADQDADDKLPRTIEAAPHQPTADEEHEIGWQWANLLWDLRVRLLQQTDLQTVNRIIFDAHLRPLAEQDSPDEPRACYFHSVQRTTWARQLDVDWNELAGIHALPVLPLVPNRGLAPQG